MMYSETVKSTFVVKRNFPDGSTCPQMLLLGVGRVPLLVRLPLDGSTVNPRECVGTCGVKTDPDGARRRFDPVRVVVHERERPCGLIEGKLRNGARV